MREATANFTKFDSSEDEGEEEEDSEEEEEVLKLEKEEEDDEEEEEEEEDEEEHEQEDDAEEVCCLSISTGTFCWPSLTDLTVLFNNIFFLSIPQPVAKDTEKTEAPSPPAAETEESLTEPTPKKRGRKRKHKETSDSEIINATEEDACITSTSVRRKSKVCSYF